MRPGTCLRHLERSTRQLNNSRGRGASGVAAILRLADNPYVGEAIHRLPFLGVSSLDFGWPVFRASHFFAFRAGNYGEMSQMGRRCVISCGQITSEQSRQLIVHSRYG